ncbi:hypothetical protein Bca52824_032200 [Brassica carinata]|uniref:Retrotransposon gag domain-containing protein n=1 Tax=Brassica carinata TaxID=52824 RepID=A0A8X7SGD7_BRACI|nr:hypothetical protein Bca52824_032200 [Brassica carinata]
MSKQIDKLRSSQTQQTEEIHGSSGLTAAEKSNEPDPPDRAHGEQRATKSTHINNNNNPPPLYHGLSSRLTKIGLPMFDGSALREWIYRCEQFFSIDSTPPEMKVGLASLHMTGKALQWHHLVSLKQGNDSIDSIDVYLEKFDCAMKRLTLPPEHVLSIFLTNMNQHLALHVCQFNVTIVPAAARISKLHELSLHYTPAKPSRSSFNPYQEKNSFNTYNTMGNQSNKPILSNTPQKRVSFVEMQERKRRGLHMYCEEPFTPGHQLTHRRSEFLFLEADPTEYDEEFALKEQIRETTINDQDVKVPTISIHALNGSPAFNCMRLMAQYGKRKLHILIDPGSTNNFLDLQIAN